MQGIYFSVCYLEVSSLLNKAPINKKQGKTCSAETKIKTKSLHLIRFETCQNAYTETKRKF